MTEELMARKRAIMAIGDPKARDIAIAMWSLNYINEYKCKPYPTKPKKVVDYCALPEEKRRAMNKDGGKDCRDFWNDIDVHNYFEAFNLIKATNRSNLDWLNDMKIKLVGTDAETAIDLAIYTHGKQDMIMDQPNWNE